MTLRQRDLARFDDIYSRLIATADIEASYGLESSAYHKARADTRLEAVRAAKDQPYIEGVRGGQQRIRSSVSSPRPEPWELMLRRARMG